VISDPLAEFFVGMELPWDKLFPILLYPQIHWKPKKITSYHVHHHHHHYHLYHHITIIITMTIKFAQHTSCDVGIVTGISFINPDERITISLANGSLPFDPQTCKKCFFVTDA
jgi:hypothetical protein